MSKSEYKAEWQRKNKEKMAMYARNYYHKRCENEPEYKVMLCNKIKSRYVSKKNKILSKIDDDAVLLIVEELDDPFIFPDPTGLDQNMNNY